MWKPELRTKTTGSTQGYRPNHKTSRALLMQPHCLLAFFHSFFFFFAASVCPSVILSDYFELRPRRLRQLHSPLSRDCLGRGHSELQILRLTRESSMRNFRGTCEPLRFRGKQKWRCSNILFNTSSPIYNLVLVSK